MIPVVVAVGLALSTFVGTPAIPETTDAPPEAVAVDVVSISGSGCRPETSSVTVSPDEASLSISFSRYNVAVGGGVQLHQLKKFCQIVIDVHAPDGYTYAVAEVDHRGRALLQQGTTLRFGSTYSFEGVSQGAASSHSWAGPLDGIWEATDRTELVGLSWAPCGESRKLTVATVATITPGIGGVSHATVDESFGYRFFWKTCPTTA